MSRKNKKKERDWNKIKQYENPMAHAKKLQEDDYRSSLLHYREVLPETFKKYSELLARMKAGSLRKGELGYVCNTIARLVAYEAKESGYFCRIAACMLKGKKNNLYEMCYNVRYYKMASSYFQLSEEAKRKLEKDFFEKYRIRIRLVPAPFTRTRK
jgi:hypothetical protein